VDLIIETPIEDLNGNPDYDGAIFNMVFERKNLNNTDFHELNPLELSKKANFYFQAPTQNKKTRLRPCLLLC
jgi:hypothetical protein